MENGNKCAIMRKLCSYMALSLLAFAAGCQREEVVSVEKDNDVMEVYATIEDVDDVQTRTYLSGTDVYWSSGDKIAVFYKNTLRKRFDVTPESIDSKDATFLQDEGYVQMGKNENISHNIAYYPFCDVTCAPDGSSYTLDNLTLPETQTYVSGSVGLGAFPMVAVTQNIDDVNFRFKNICGVMQFQLTGYGYVKSVSVKGNNEEILSGPAVVTAGYGKEPSIAMSAEGGKSVTLDCGEGGVELNETTPVSFFIVLPPVQFEGGFTITVTDTWGGSKEYSTTKKNPVGRSKGLRMPAKEYVGERPVQEGDYIDEYGKNHGQGIEIDGVVWAPVNCGYHATDFKYGKLYQWGRKYGQGYGGNLYVGGAESGTYKDALVPTISKEVGSMEVGQYASNSNVFYLSSGEFNFDWTDLRCNTLWNVGTEENPVKTEYDPCPDGWRVPTYAELDGLRQHSSSWTTNEYGQAGYWFYGTGSHTSETSQIFFPAAAYRYYSDGKAYNRGLMGNYWSSKPSRFSAHYLDFNNDDISMLGTFRSNGYSVRCVRDDSELIPIESIALDHTYLVVYADQGEAFSLDATISPANANHQTVYWHSDDTSVVLPADEKGNMIAVNTGVATVTAMAGMKVAECLVTVLPKADMEYVDENGVSRGKGTEVDGVIWAPVNCGYDVDNPYGKLYQWGRKYGQKYGTGSIMNGPASLEAGSDEKYKDIFFWSSAQSPFNWCVSNDSSLWNTGTEENPVKTQYDPCPKGWRVPTYSEMQSLASNMSPEMCTNEGQKGYWLCGSSNYSDAMSKVFLPAAGYIYYDGSSSNKDEEGCYWSSTPWASNEKYYSCRFSFTRTNTSDYSRGNGFSVRCVQE